MKRIKFIHAADLHLDSPMVGLQHLPDDIFEQIRNSTFTALSNIIDYAIEQRVDFVIFSGDLFDSDERSVRAQVRFRAEMERLNELGIKVFIIHGNHDYLNASWTLISMPSNVIVFRDQVEKHQFRSNCGTVVNLYGFSYGERHIYEPMIENYKKQGQADYHIGLLHGHSEGRTNHSRYAPFKISDLLEKNFDYWALGHIHKREILHKDPYIVYPGNIQGLNRLEVGEKGCYCVTIIDGTTSLEWVDAAPIQWSHKIIDGTPLSDFDSLYNLCISTLNELRQKGKKQFVYLQIENIQNEVIVSDFNNSDLLSILQQFEQAEQIFVYPFSIELVESNFIKRDQLMYEAPFYRELFNVIDNFTEWDGALSYLYDFHRMQPHLDKLTKEQQVALLKDAEQIVLRLLNDEKI